MSLIEQVRNVVAEFSECFEDDQRVGISTQFLYPSNEAVTVFVSPAHAGTYRVSDDGGAMDTLSAHGIAFWPDDRKLTNFCAERGLKHNEGMIVAKRIPLEAVTTAIIGVASASRDFAFREVKNIRGQRRRDLRASVQKSLELVFPAERIRHTSPVTGFTNRQYDFDFSINLTGERRLLIDTVVPDRKSLNAVAIANIDVSKAENPHLEQRIVYDDEDTWSAADLSLLQLAATTVPFSSFQKILGRFESRI